MNHSTQHPSDESLFDFTSGTLPRARSREISSHIEACPACAALVDAATAGQRHTESAVQQLPAEAAARMHAAIGEEWNQRMFSRPRARSRMPQWRRMLNVGLAVGMVATLLGVATTQFTGTGDENRVQSGGAESATQSLDSSVRDSSSGESNLSRADEQAGNGAGQSGSSTGQSRNNAGTGATAEPAMAPEVTAGAPAADSAASPAAKTAPESPQRDADAVMPNATSEIDRGEYVTDAVEPPECVLELGSTLPARVQPPPPSSTTTIVSAGPISSVRWVCGAAPPSTDAPPAGISVIPLGQPGE